MFHELKKEEVFLNRIIFTLSFFNTIANCRIGVK